jgi:oxidase EvaA
LQNSDYKLYETFFRDKALYQSIFTKNKKISRQAFTMLNNYKMYKNVVKEVVPLQNLKNWILDEKGISCTKEADFDVRYYDIEIEGREVQSWAQPLFKARSSALFVLFTRVNNGIREFLISLRPEIGCFDKVEFGPSLQIANAKAYHSDDSLYQTFLKHDKSKEGFFIDVMMSEEGGRFYHEQNRNVIVEVEKGELPFSEDTLWVDYATLNSLLVNNNLLNIQLRNLISLLEI